MRRLSQVARFLSFPAVVSFGVLAAQGCGTNSNSGPKYQTVVPNSTFADSGVAPVATNEPEPDIFTPPAETATDAGPALLDSGCATASAEASRIPLYMLIVLDGSGSMNGEKWQAARSALSEVFDDLALKNDPAIAVGLMLYSGSLGERADSYPSSDDVGLARVDSRQATRLKARVLPKEPGGTTPTYQAMNGAYRVLRLFSPSGTLLPGGKKITVLMSDGVPTDRKDDVVQLAAANLADTSNGGAISTFAVGIGSLDADPSDYDPAFMGDLAVAGGTPSSAACVPHSTKPSELCYFQVTPGGSVPSTKQAFLEALNNIRTKAAGCEFALDKSSNRIDPALVNVVYTDKDGKEQLIPESAADGWTYDDPKNPSTVKLNGDWCSKVTSNNDAKVRIILGCTRSVN